MPFYSALNFGSRVINNCNFAEKTFRKVKVFMQINTRSKSIKFQTSCFIYIPDKLILPTFIMQQPDEK